MNTLGQLRAHLANIGPCGEDPFVEIANAVRFLCGKIDELTCAIETIARERVPPPFGSK